MLTTLLLWKSKTMSTPHFYISGYLEDNKELYLETMRNVSKTGDWDEWCLFFLGAAEKQTINNLSVAENIKNLYEEMKPIFTETLNSKWSLSTLDCLFTFPFFRSNKLTDRSIPPQSATRFIKLLFESELIIKKENSSGRRATLYCFESLMDLVRV